MTQETEMNRDVDPSSGVVAIGYDPPTQTLEVEFLKGSVYQYYGVPKHMYEHHASAIERGIPEHLYQGQLSIF